jgi:choline-glycine betaine transporter
MDLVNQNSITAMIEFVKQLMKDKDGNYCLREAVTLVFVAVTLISWIAQQFFGISVPEYMFYSFVSIIGAGCFGYSIEKKAKPYTNENKNEVP